MSKDDKSWVLTFRVETKLVNLMDLMVLKGYYLSRSELVRRAIRELIVNDVLRKTEKALIGGKLNE